MRRTWFDRKFQLGMPLDALPDVIERLRGTPLRLRERVSHATPDRLRARPEEQWSIQEHAGHLADLEVLWMARVQDFLAGRQDLVAADLQNRATWDAMHNEREMEPILAEFASRRAALVDAVVAMPDAARRSSALHPRLKQPMTVVDHCFFVAEHDDHHLAAITERLVNPG